MTKIKDLLERFSDRKKYFFSIAYEMASEAHKDQKRNNGITPYMTHVDAVILRVFSEADEIYNDRIVDIIISVAALHDTEEDHGYTYSRGLFIDVFERERGTLAEEDSDIFEVVDALTAITKLPKARQEPYHLYVMGVKSNQWARLVKIHDLNHNMSDLTYGNLLQKYQLTHHFLTH